MVRNFKLLGCIFLLVVILEVLLPGCSGHYSDRIPVSITFSSRLSQKTGRQSAISDVFALKENEDIYAVIALDSLGKVEPGGMMFHIDWTGPDGRSFYLKRIDLSPGDSTTALISSISVSQSSRIPGVYKVRIYLFRELLAEKSFEIRAANEVEKVKTDIFFFKSQDKESGELIGIDTIFEIKKKGILRAQVSLSDLDVYHDEELSFRLEWISPDGTEFYSKKIDVLQADSVSVISSSISITPDKRGPGEYFLRVYLFDDVIGEERFVLVPSD
jgi:hypothetical protein